VGCILKTRVQRFATIATDEVVNWDQDTVIVNVIRIADSVIEVTKLFPTGYLRKVYQDSVTYQVAYRDRTWRDKNTIGGGMTVVISKENLAVLGFISGQ
jgi:putative heme iron utilization protein